MKGLSIKVPDNWWPGYNDQILHDGKIDSFDPLTQKWNLLLDSNDDDALYLMAYDAVCEYSNKQSSTFHEFQLPHQPVYEDDDEIETADGTRYTATATSEWSEVNMHDNGGRSINPVEWPGGTDGTEDSTVNITAEELEKLKDDNGETWRRHQSVPMLVKGTGRYCQYKKCPGLDTIQKRARPYKTYYRCDECSIDKGECVWLCNTRKMIDGKPQVVACHLKYHSEK